MKRATCIGLIFLGLSFSRPAVAQSAAPVSAPGVGAPQAGTANMLHLDLPGAEALALQNHPRLRASQLSAAAAGEIPTEVRSAYYPMISGNFTGALADHDSRISAGSLNNPIVYGRYANGLELDQLVTDFGRTHNLVASSRLEAQAAEAGAQVTRADVLLGVDTSYYSALKAQAVLRVAQQTTQERQVVVDQVSAMTANKLKSGLDLSFAKVNLAQAQLLLTQAENNRQASYAELSMALGFTDLQDFDLADGTEEEAALPDQQQVIAEAFQNRPELAQQRDSAEAAKRFATAERDLYFPTLSILGDAGFTPYRPDVVTDRYAAAGFNLSLPIFEGHLFGARRAEADLQAQSESQTLRDVQNRIARDVRQAWLNANTAFQNLDLTAQLLTQANKALELAQERYKLGLSSIVELSQAQLNDAQAQIQQAAAKYDYRSQLATLRYQEGLLH